MYLRAAHAETSLQPLINFIQQNPLGILTTAISSQEYPLIQHTYLPWVLEPPTNLDVLEKAGQANAKPIGNVKSPVRGLEGCTLRGHMARANPHSKALIEAVGANNGWIRTEVTISFSSPAQHYITPKYYVETKPNTGKVVPTWNYTAVECRGVAWIYHDKTIDTGEYLQTQIEALTRMSEVGLESDFGRRQQSIESDGSFWEVSDAPKPYVEILKKAIMGIEIQVESIVGKFKMSQELTPGDRAGVKDGLRKRKDEKSQLVADIVDRRSNGS